MGHQKSHLAVGGHAVSSANRVPVEIAGGDLTSYIRDVQRGNVSGSRVVEQVVSVSLATNTTHTLWSLGNSGNQPVQTSTVSLELLSSSANDTAAGSGAREIVVEGLDSNFAVKTATVATNGTGAVSLGSGWLRINFAHVSIAGSSQINEGNITIRIASGGANQAQMPGNWGTLSQVQYTVPAGKTAYLLGLSFGSMGDTEVQTIAAIAAGTGGGSTSNLPLLSTTLIGFYGETGATAADLIYRQRQRLFAYRGAHSIRDYGFSFKLNAKGIYAPSVQNTTPKTVEFVASALYLEEDAA